MVSSRLVKVEEMPDAELAEVAQRLAAALAPRAQAVMFKVNGGTPWEAAAREVGISTNARVLGRMKKRVAPALAALAEQKRRKSIESAEDAARWFDSLAQEARKAKDYSAAARAKKEASTLRGQYPETRLRLQLDAPGVDTHAISDDEWAALARLRHEVRPALPATVDVAVTPVPEPAPEPDDLYLDDILDVPPSGLQEVPASALDSGTSHQNARQSGPSAPSFAAPGDKGGDHAA